MIHSRLRCLYLLLAASLLASCPALAADSTGPGWNYAGGGGPDSWGELAHEYAACSLGSEQSPVDIRHAIAAELPELQIDWKPGGSIVDNGHAIEVEAEGGTLRYGEAIYDLLQFHFHAPAEHLVEGVAAPVEVHFVHRARDTGDLAVLGIFVQAGEANPAFAALAAALPGKAHGQPGAVAIEPADLLPDQSGYWVYQGSLTTPPCSETVRWFILRHPLEAAQADIDAFTALYPMNARPTQPVKRRFILSSK